MLICRRLLELAVVGTMGDTEGIPPLALGNTLWLRGTGPRGCLPAVYDPALTHNPIPLHPGGVVISRWSDRFRHVAGPGSVSKYRQRQNDTVLRIVLAGRIPRDDRSRSVHLCTTQTSRRRVPGDTHHATAMMSISLSSKLGDLRFLQRNAQAVEISDRLGPCNYASRSSID